jgi:hypothetical protein
MMLDIYDGEPWSDAAIEDLVQAIAAGATLEDTAAFLCRSGDPFAVAKKGSGVAVGIAPFPGARG